MRSITSTRLSVALCLLTATFPLLCFSGLGEVPADVFVGACLGVPSQPVLVGLAVTAWVWRGSRPAAHVVLAATTVATVVSGWLWWAGSQDPKGFTPLFSAVVAPLAQVVAWGVGVVAACWVARPPEPQEREPAEPGTAPDPVA